MYSKVSVLAEVGVSTVVVVVEEIVLGRHWRFAKGGWLSGIEYIEADL